MKINIETLQDTFKISYDALIDSYMESLQVLELYHNRQYTDNQAAILDSRGQPKETFNIIKMFGRMLIGYYSTIVNEVTVTAKKESQVVIASILNDLVSDIFSANNFYTEGDKLKLDAMLTGLMCCYIEVVETGEVDSFNRPLRQVKVQHVPSIEILYDPLSRLDSFDDARWVHRFKWVPKESIIKLYGEEKLKNLEAYVNNTDIIAADFSFAYNTEFVGKYNRLDNYLVIHTIITDDEEKTWSIQWSGDVILHKEEITFREVRSPYRLHRLHTSNKAEHYGIFRDIIETQHAINQAIIKIQLMVNTQKAFVEETAVEDLEEFTRQFYRVNSIIQVKDLNGVRIEKLSSEVQDQYIILDKALDRVQKLLSINDSFLGMAYASDSGSKVKLQQNASIVALRYITSRVEQFYKLIGKDVLSLIKQYYTAHHVKRIADDYFGERWLEINKPLMVETGRIDYNTGEPEMEPLMEEQLDPATLEPLKDEKGNILIAPVPTEDTEIAFTDADISVESVAYDDTEDNARLVFEQFINGPIGQMLSQVNPIGYFKIAQLSIRTVKMKYSPDISQILADTVDLLANNQQAQMIMQQGMLEAQGSPAATMKKRESR